MPGGGQPSLPGSRLPGRAHVLRARRASEPPMGRHAQSRVTRTRIGGRLEDRWQGRVQRTPAEPAADAVAEGCAAKGQPRTGAVARRGGHAFPSPSVPHRSRSLLHVRLPAPAASLPLAATPHGQGSFRLTFIGRCTTTTPSWCAAPADPAARGSVHGRRTAPTRRCPRQPRCSCTELPDRHRRFCSLPHVAWRAVGDPSHGTAPSVGAVVAGPAGPHRVATRRRTQSRSLDPAGQEHER